MLFFVTVLYNGFDVKVTVVLCMKKSYPGNLWSETAAMFGLFRIRKTCRCLTVRVMESIHPMAVCCRFSSFCLLFADSSFVTFVEISIKGRLRDDWPSCCACLWFLLNRKYYVCNFTKKIRNVSGNEIICWIKVL